MKEKNNKNPKFSYDAPGSHNCLKILDIMGDMRFEKSQNSFNLNIFGTTASHAFLSVSGEGFDIAALVSASATKKKSRQMRFDMKKIMKNYQI